MDIFTTAFIILNLPALIAMIILLSRNTKLKIYQKISWALLLIISPIISLVLFTVKGRPMVEEY